MLNSLSVPTSSQEDLLGVLAMKFRGTPDSCQRRAIADDYSHTVDQLIQGGTWQNFPSSEDLLPRDWMPKEFYRYWNSRVL